MQMVPDNLMVFTGSANLRLATSVAHQLNIRLGKAQVSRFSDGEVMVEVFENVRGKDVFVLQSTSAPTNDNLMELLIWPTPRSARRRAPHRHNSLLR